MRYVGLATMALLLALCGYLYLDRGRVQQAIVAERASHGETKANIRAAQALADKLQAEHLLAEAKKNAKTNDRIRDEYETRIADFRLRAGQLYVPTQSRTAAVSDSGGGNVSERSAPEGATPPRAEGGLPADDALIASEQGAQLQGLLDWIEVRYPSDEPPPGSP